MWVVCAAGLVTAGHAQQKKPKHYAYQQIDLEELVRRFISKTPEPGSIEGIYSVSCAIIKRNKSWITGQEREREVNHKDNYAKVAILKDWPGSDTQYIELSLNANEAPHYPIVSTITSLANSAGFLFTHYEPDNTRMTFTFTLDGYPDLLEGAYTTQHRKATIVYKLSYFRTFPKDNPAVSK